MAKNEKTRAKNLPEPSRAAVGRTEDVNPDPITGEPGAHPVGTGIGAASGGLAGVAIGGAVGGPVGAVIGGAIGAAAGGLAGKGVAEGVNPTEEDAFWRGNYRTRDYVDANQSYDLYQPAYRYGWESRSRVESGRFDEAEPQLERGWSKARGESDLGWPQARAAVRDAWDRIGTRGIDVQGTEDRVAGRTGLDDDAYWRENYRNRPYFDSTRSYDDYAPAYSYGRVAADRYTGSSFDAIERDLEEGWERVKGKSKLTWHQAKAAVHDAWERITHATRSGVAKAERALDLDDDHYWREAYTSRPYYEPTRTYDDYAPAYAYGRMAAAQYRGRTFDDVEVELERAWQTAKGNSRLAWKQAKGAVRDAWHHVERAMPGDADNDGV